MSKFVKYEQCPKCAERGKDSRGDNLAVYSDGGGHCFSCGFHVHPPSSNRWSSIPVELDNKVKRILPDDFTWDVPSRAWEWLLQYGLPYDYWKGIVGWSEKHQRLVFRVGDPLRFSIGRSFSEKRDLHSYRKWHVWGDSHSSVESFGQGGSSIAMVEDLLSAHKVGQVSQAVCIFGTKIYPNHLEYLRKQNKNIILWLDNDQLDTMPRKCANLELLTGVKVNYVSTLKDPKEYSLRDISSIIGGIDGGIRV